MLITMKKAFLPVKFFGGFCMFIQLLIVGDWLYKGLTFTSDIYILTIALMFIWYVLLTFFVEIKIDSSRITKRVGIPFLNKKTVYNCLKCIRLEASWVSSPGTPGSPSYWAFYVKAVDANNVSINLSLGIEAEPTKEDFEALVESVRKIIRLPVEQSEEFIKVYKECYGSAIKLKKN